MATKQIYGPTSAWIQDLTIVNADIANQTISEVNLGLGSVTQPKLKLITLVGLADAAANPTAAQLVGSSYFTMTPTAGRAFNAPSAANIVAAFTDPQVGTWFRFYIVNLSVGAFAVTVTDPGGIGITLTGQMAVLQNESHSFLGVITNVAAPAVTIVMA